MIFKVFQEIYKGKGQIVLKIPFESISQKYDVSIKCIDDFQNAIKNIIEGITDNKWLDLFEHGIINKYGYPITYEFSQNIGMQPNRFMHLLQRPNKTVAIKPYEHMLYEFGDALVVEIFGSDFELAKISILMSEAEAREQVLHIDYTAKDTDEEIDFAIIFTFKVMGCLSGCDFSQHIVRAVHIAKQKVGENADPATYFSIVREELRKNVDFKIDIDDCVKKVIHFGIDEMLVFGANYVHGGAENDMCCRVFRVHYYITRKGICAPNNQTVIVDNIVWDLTKARSLSKNIVFSQFENSKEYDAYKKEKEAIDNAANKIVSPIVPKKAGRKPKVPSQVQQSSTSATAERSLEPQQAPKKRGRPRLLKNKIYIDNEQKPKLGRPPKIKK